MRIKRKYILYGNYTRWHKSRIEFTKNKPSFRVSYGSLLRRKAIIQTNARFSIRMIEWTPRDELQWNLNQSPSISILKYILKLLPKKWWPYYLHCSFFTSILGTSPFITCWQVCSISGKWLMNFYNNEYAPSIIIIHYFINFVISD